MLYVSALLVWFGISWSRGMASANKAGSGADEPRYEYVLRLALRTLMVLVGTTTIFFILFLLPRIV